jgi:hypothetical protein
MKKKKVTLQLTEVPTLGDAELEALAAIVVATRGLCFDQLWRVFNYVIDRRFGRSWILRKPANE